MSYILVSGANKGIGLAVAEAILREHRQYKVLLGSRDCQRGERAREALLATDDAWSGRVRVLELDVGSEESVTQARSLVAELAEGQPAPLYGLVNNAGAGVGELSEVLNVNVYGIQRMCEAFSPLIQAGGRIVNVTSASGPNFVARCDRERQAFFLDQDMSWERLDGFMRSCQQLAPGEFQAMGMESDTAYGLSKACANSYTHILARRHPQLLVNACTPGFIETDLGKDFLGERTPAEAGMKSPAEGARVILSLLFSAMDASGHYYGSDGLRSPLDRYRAPGSPAYAGESND